MKSIQLTELEKQALLSQKEALSIEHDGEIIGYYFPVVDHQTVKKAKADMDRVMEEVLAQTGFTEEEFVSLFMNADRKSCA